MTTRWFRPIVAVVTAVGLVACTAEPGGDSNHPTTSAAPKDRDPRAVIAALRQTDLCTTVESSGMRLRADTPFDCAVVTEPSIVAIYADMFAPDLRRNMTARTIGGAKAYVDHERSCTVVFPVSFEIAIVLLATKSDRVPDPCKPTEQLATLLATTLTGPGVSPIKPTWDACSAVTEVMDESEIRSVNNSGNLNSCSIPAPDPKSPLLEDFFLWYGKPKPTWPRETIGSTEVWVGDNISLSGKCTVAWKLDTPPPTSFVEKGTIFLASTSADDCVRARELAEMMIPVVAEPPPDDVTPQHPLLYGPDEPDMP